MQDAVGLEVMKLGLEVGLADVGSAVTGWVLGDLDGPCDGDTLGKSVVGASVGLLTGDRDGSSVGDRDGSDELGEEVGS